MSIFFQTFFFLIILVRQRHKKKNRKPDLHQTSCSSLHNLKNINAKFYRQVHEASHHHSRMNSPLLSTWHHSNESHQLSAYTSPHYTPASQRCIHGLAKMISIPTDWLFLVPFFQEHNKQASDSRRNRTIRKASSVSDWSSDSRQST